MERDGTVQTPDENNPFLFHSPRSLNPEEVKMQLEQALQRLQIEEKIKEGAENMLQIYENQEEKKHLKRKVETQLENATRNIDRLTRIVEKFRNISGGVSDTSSALPNGPVPLSSLSWSGANSGSSRRARAPAPAPSDASILQADDTRTIKERISDILNQLRAANEPASTRVEQLQLLVRILSTVTTISEHYSVEELIIGLRICLCDPIKEVRALAYNSLRHLISDVETIKLILSYNVDLFIIRSLGRGSSAEPERDYALKLVRQIMDTPHGVDLISEGVVRAITAIAEQLEDKLMPICLETLAELAVHNISLVVKGGGMRALLHALVDGPRELADTLPITLLYILDAPATRCYVRSGVDLEIAVSGFTDAYTRGPNYEKRLQRSAQVVLSLLKHWTGIIYLCADGKKSIKSMVESLRFSHEEIQKILLGMFFDIFRIRTPPEYDLFLAGRRHSVYVGRMVHEDNSEEQDPEDAELLRFKDRLNLLDAHLSILLIVFIEAGLLEALISLIEGNDVFIRRKATLLIGEILQLCTRLLPASWATKIQSLPRLFELAAKFEDEAVRHSATAALNHIDRLIRLRNRTMVEDEDDRSERPFGKKRERNKRQVEQVKVRMGIQIDDLHFRNLLMDTQVLNTKDYTKWNWDNILELLHGPLLNPRRLEDTIKSTFMKRLIGFYQPYSRRFSEIRATKGNKRYVKIGCALLTTLLASADGTRYLAENKLLQDIADCLTELDPLSASEEPLFSRERMANTLTSAYFTFLGTLSKFQEGMRIMERFKIFNQLYRLSESRSREDLIKAMVVNFDYSMHGHPRIILAKIMTSSYKHIRLFATQHLGRVLRESPTKINDWAVPLLITQLYDPNAEVARMAVTVLDEACNYQENLDLLVQLRPSLDHLGEAGKPLLLRFLSTSTGFRYLNELDYIGGEMDDWFYGRNLHYVTQLEISLMRAMINTPERKKPSVFEERIDDEVDFEKLQPGDGITPPHFYGELTKTAEGCQLLREKGHFHVFAEYIREWGMESQDMEAVQKLKSILWAVGNIGSTKDGLPFLEEEDVIRSIVEIAEKSEVLSLKGTCFYVLGLISKTQQGIDLLEEFGWDCVTSPTTRRPPPGLCVPAELSSFLSISEWAYAGELAPQPQTLYLHWAGKSEIDTRILKAIGDLSNHILASAASRTLVRLKQQIPEAFRSAGLYRATLEMLSSYRYRFGVRKFALELFDEASIMNECGGDMMLAKDADADHGGALSTAVNGGAVRAGQGAELGGELMLEFPSYFAAEDIQSESYQERGVVAGGVADGIDTGEIPRAVVLEPGIVVRGFDVAS
ncbi:uncharacterized protein VTP21DRAFT_10536 [Calcarisporiella thermophila]|uniref:uncharacterized protein n=1 Tax=Calcarisporiella thermophila TaxID=911321 RepID=UPI003742F2EE